VADFILKLKSIFYFMPHIPN